MNDGNSSINRCTGNFPTVFAVREHCVHKTGWRRRPCDVSLIKAVLFYFIPGTSSLFHFTGVVHSFGHFCFLVSYSSECSWPFSKVPVQFFYYHHKPSCFSSSPSCGFCLYCCPDFLPHACLRLFHNVICYDCAFVLVCGYVPHDCLNGSLTEASQMESCVRIEEIIHSSS